MLIVEDGTGRADAEALCAVAFADAYLAARGVTAWAALSESQKEAALRLSADYLEQAYAGRWAGRRLNATQALSWPRYEAPTPDADGAYLPSDAVPVVVQQAAALLAVKASSAELAPDVGRLKQSVTIGPISTAYVQGAAPYTRYRAVDNMLAPLMRAGGSMIAVVRA